MVEIAKAVIKKGEKYLFIKRVGISKHFPNTWDFVGGKLDPGETPEEACIREAKEESNYDVVINKYLGKIIHEDSSYDYPIFLHYFEIKSYSGEFKLSKDHTAYAWFSKEEIMKKELHPSIKLYFEKLNSTQKLS